MKVHLVIDGSMTCTPNVGRLTTRSERTTQNPSDTTCAACKRRLARMRPEFVATLGTFGVPVKTYEELSK